MIALTADWVVMQDLADYVYLDSIVLLRLDYVTKVEPHGSLPYVQRAIAGLGQQIEHFDCAPDASSADLLRLASARAKLVWIYLETLEDYRLSIGQVHHIGNKRVDIQFIGRDGVWVEFTDAWKVKDITRIEIGGRYLRALEQFGDPIVPAKKRVKQ